jgi:hypothetical protein
VNGSERIKANCASGLSVKVIESKFTGRAAVRSSVWLDLIGPRKEDKFRKVIPRVLLLSYDLARRRWETCCSNRLRYDLRRGSVRRPLGEYSEA